LGNKTLVRERYNEDESDSGSKYDDYE